MKLLKRIKAILRLPAVKFREWVERNTRKHPVFISAAENGGGFLFVILSSFFSTLTNNRWITLPVIFFTTALLYAFQWAKLTNRRIKEVDEALNQGIEEGERLREEGRTKEVQETNVALDWLGSKSETLIESISLCHAVSHRAKYIACNFKSQDCRSANKDLVDMCTAVLNSLETILTKHYGKTISASIKIVSGDDTFITAARGKNNIASRGGQIATAAYNKREIKYTDNYAYRALIEDGAKFFSEKDLVLFSSKKKPEDEFYCEYKKWEKLFISTIVVPIRIFYDSGMNNDYVGVVCVDCNEIIPEWDCCIVEEELAYGIIATIADALYLPMNEFRKIAG